MTNPLPEMNEDDVGEMIMTSLKRSNIRRICLQFGVGLPEDLAGYLWLRLVKIKTKDGKPVENLTAWIDNTVTWYAKRFCRDDKNSRFIQSEEEQK